MHIFGYPCEIGRINEIAAAAGVPVVEDACEALGARIDGATVGSHGNPAVYGFYPNKQLTTGEGGAITTDDEDVARELRSIVNQGRSDDGDWLVHQRLGFNFRMDEMSAAVGRRPARQAAGDAGRARPPGRPLRRAAGRRAGPRAAAAPARTSAAGSSTTSSSTRRSTALR